MAKKIEGHEADIQKIVKKIVAKNSLSALAFMRVEGGRAMVSNTYEWLTWKLDAENGYYDARFWADTGKLRSFPSEEVNGFPWFPAPSLEGKTMLVLGPQFPDQWRAVKQHASKDESRYFMNGVAFTSNGDMVATDGKTMAYVNLGQELSLDGESAIIDTSHALGHGEEAKAKEIYFNVKPELKDISHCAFTCTLFRFDNAELYVKEIGLQFPNYRRIIPDYPEADTFHFYVPGKKDLSAALKQAKLARNGAKAFPLVYVTSQVFAVAEHNMVGIKEDIPVLPDSPVLFPDCKIDRAFPSGVKLNAEYMQKVTAFSDGPVKMTGMEEQKAVFGMDSNGVTHIVMPMQCDDWTGVKEKLVSCYPEVYALSDKPKAVEPKAVEPKDKGAWNCLQLGGVVEFVNHEYFILTNKQRGGTVSIAVKLELGTYKPTVGEKLYVEGRLTTMVFHGVYYITIVPTNVESLS